MKKLIISLCTIFFAVTFQNGFSFSVEEASIDSIHVAMQKHQLSCEQLIDIYVQRIKVYNLSGKNHVPLNAFTEINSNVLDQARQLDRVYSQTQQFVGPLHCIPVVLKDNIDSYDSTTTAGTLALLGNQPNKDAFLVSRLRKAGAVILGKGGMDELASGAFGISSRSGRIGNAYDAEKNPGGSSGGSAVAISANFAVIGIGTDNSGSVRIPAAFNGIYGLRPSRGLISQHGIFPSGNLDGTAGPLARSVEDLAVVLDVISSMPRVKKYTAYLNQNGLNAKRIGIVRSVGKIDTFKSMPNNVMQLLQKELQTMKQAGATIVDNIDLPAFDNDRSFNLAGMKQDVDAYLNSYPAVRKNFRDICESDRTRVFGDVNACLKFIDSIPIKYGDKYQMALQIFAKNKKYVEKIMRQQHLDALLIPISRTGVATYDAKAINTWQAPVSSNAGLPSITINLGYIDKMPVGVELVGKKYAEGTLIGIAYAYEKKSPPRIPPALPEKNNVLEKWNIAEYNNFITNIGYRSYMEILKKSADLTPEAFAKIMSSIGIDYRLSLSM